MEVLPILLLALSPLLGYCLLRWTRRRSAVSVLGGVAVFLAAVYAVLRWRHLLLLGEEGDYYGLSFCFLVFVIACFQALRIRREALRLTLFVLGTVLYSPVALWSIWLLSVFLLRSLASTTP